MMRILTMEITGQVGILLKRRNYLNLKSQPRRIPKKNQKKKLKKRKRKSKRNPVQPIRKRVGYHQLSQKIQIYSLAV